MQKNECFSICVQNLVCWGPVFFGDVRLFTGRIWIKHNKPIEMHGLMGTSLLVGISKLVAEGSIQLLRYGGPGQICC